uniref:Large ribosomal subunit protein uL4m n=1 Tax=Anser cygnoides TaxID=8845 RepID=A0A8B9IIC6_ANSCY
GDIVGVLGTLPAPPPSPSPSPPSLSLSPSPSPLSPVLRAVGVPVAPGGVAAQAWLGSLRHPAAERLGLAELHPDVFAVAPRWGLLGGYAKVKTRAEVRGGGRKPWRQKGTGRARHSSIRSPLWRGGGIAHGPRGPTSYYYLLPMKVRVLGLKTALTVKLMQDQLHVVDNLEVPTADPRYLQDLARYRHWGSSVLIVDV